MRTGLRILLSAFVVWHTLAIALAPAPGSYSMAQVWPFVKPYLSLLHLEGQWSLFAPDPAAGILLRYRLIGSGDPGDALPLSEVVPRSSPSYFRQLAIHLSVSERFPEVMQSVASRLCRRHANDAPEAIQFLQVHQVPLHYRDFQAGARPLDREFTHVVELAPIACREREMAS